VDNDGHSVTVRGAEHTAAFLDMLRVVEVNVRVAKMQLEAGIEPAISGAARDLFERIVFEVDAAKSRTVGNRAPAAGKSFRPTCACCSTSGLWGC
jgi:hypothetical protein